MDRAPAPYPVPERAAPAAPNERPSPSRGVRIRFFERINLPTKE